MVEARLSENSRSFHVAGKIPLAENPTKVQRDFDKTVNTFPNRNLRTGDLLFLDVRDSPAEKVLFERRRNKLDPKTMGHFLVSENRGHTLDIDVNGIPERILPDRVTPAPGNVEHRKSDDLDTDIITNGIGKPIIDKTSPSRRPITRLPHSPDELKDNLISSKHPEGSQSVQNSTEEFVIEKLEKLGEDKYVKNYVFVKWYMFPRE